VRRLLLAAILGLASGARAESAFYAGKCELADDPAQLDFAACLRGGAGAEITAVNGAPHENYWLRFARGSLGLYYGEYVSVQGRAHLRDTLPLNGADKNLDRDADLALVQVGNPVLHRFVLQAGRMPLPFGLDKTWTAESYQIFENRSFWASPRYGAAVGIDNLVNTHLDLGYAEDDPGHPGQITAASARLSYDFAALDGSRVVASGYGENHGVRRFSFGVINVSRREDTTEVELVRRLEEPTGGRREFQQLFRIGYAGAYRGAGRWIVQFDDERFRYRMGTIGQDLRLKTDGLVRFALVYQKSEAGDGKKRWMLTTGLGVAL
jgi:hypothetical protein